MKTVKCRHWSMNEVTNSLTFSCFVFFFPLVLCPTVILETTIFLGSFFVTYSRSGPLRTVWSVLSVWPTFSKHTVDYSTLLKAFICFLSSHCSFGCFSSRVFSIHIFLLITHTSGSEARSLFECTRRRSPNFSQFPLKTSNRSSTSSFEKGGNKQAWDELCPHQVAWWVSSNDSETSHLRTPYSTISQGRNLESKGIDIVILRRPTLAHTSWKWEWSRAKSV